MDIPSKIPVSSGLKHPDIEDKTTSVSPKAVDVLPMLECQRPAVGMTGLESRSLAKKVKNLSSHEEVVDRIIQNQITSLTVDDESRQTMAEALAFSGIDTLEQAESLNLRIIPPGPILHTWYAIYHTGLFDGKNNPHHVKGLNYVVRISEQADRLKEWGIPVLLVYLERDMPSSELMKMQEVFSEHENILVMSLERDLTSLKSADYFKHTELCDLLDDPRYFLCAEFPELLRLAGKKAESSGKRLLLKNLKALGGHSMIYSDIDNTFLRKPMFQLAKYGVRNACPFREEFSLQKDNILKNYSSTQKLYDIARRHKDIFSHEGVICKRKERLPTDTLKYKADSLYKYLVSDEARENYRLLEPGLDTDMRLFLHESAGYIALDKEALSIVEPPSNRIFAGNRWMNALTDKQDLNNQLLNLHGLQQLRQIHIGRDLTWTST